jgi:hypothetical protein
MLKKKLLLKKKSNNRFQIILLALLIIVFIFTLIVFFYLHKKVNYLENKRGERGTRGDMGLTGPKGGMGQDGLYGASGNKGMRGQIGNLGMTGNKGNDGDDGDTGDKGFNGPQGYYGDDGEQGNLGDRGQGGFTGIHGDYGNEGDQGNMGYSGNRGNGGNKGTQGEFGNQGFVGLDGIDGNRGNKGSTGNTGSSGSCGAEGNLGPYGNKGVLGDRGYGGPSGNKGNYGSLGNKGQKGLIGNKGSKGSKGTKGSTGIHGATGPKGAQGQGGLRGNTGGGGDRGPGGALGTLGNKGGRGNAGALGSLGNKGNRGKYGLTGNTGSTGYSGSSGNKGSIGSTGAQGHQGDTGATGNTGNAGNTGNKGNTGNQGAQGNQGSKGQQGVHGSAGGAGNTGNDNGVSFMINFNNRTIPGNHNQTIYKFGRFGRCNSSNKSIRSATCIKSDGTETSTSSIGTCQGGGKKAAGPSIEMSETYGNKCSKCQSDSTNYLQLEPKGDRYTDVTNKSFDGSKYMIGNITAFAQHREGKTYRQMRKFCNDNYYCVGFQVKSKSITYYKYQPGAINPQFEWNHTGENNNSNMVTYNGSKYHGFYRKPGKLKIYHDNDGNSIKAPFELDMEDKNTYLNKRAQQLNWPAHPMAPAPPPKPRPAPPPIVWPPIVWPPPPPVCFPASSSVKLRDGSQIRMDTLKIGDCIKTRDGFSKIYMFIHYLPNTTAYYYKINNMLEISENHFISVNNLYNFILTKYVKIGDIIFINNKQEKVTSIDKIKNYGMYAPVTFDGNLIVDDVLVSSYATAGGLNHYSTAEGPSHLEYNCFNIDLPFFGTIINGNTTIHIGMSPIRLINRFYSCLNDKSYNKKKYEGRHDIVYFFLNFLEIKTKILPRNSDGSYKLLYPPSFIFFFIFICPIYILDLIVSFFMKIFGIETLI